MTLWRRQVELTTQMLGVDHAAFDAPCDAGAAVTGVVGDVVVVDAGGVNGMSVGVALFRMVLAFFQPAMVVGPLTRSALQAFDTPRSRTCIVL